MTNTNSAPAAGTFPWTIAEIEEELTETRQAWRDAKSLGWATAQIEKAGRMWATYLDQAKANGGYILI